MAKTCPQCGHAEVETDACPRCGVIVSKCRGALQELGQKPAGPSLELGGQEPETEEHTRDCECVPSNSAELLCCDKTKKDREQQTWPNDIWMHCLDEVLSVHTHIPGQSQKRFEAGPHAKVRQIEGDIPPIIARRLEETI